MADGEKIVTGFYTEFVLRDVLSFVTPGAILLGSLLYALWPLDSIINEFQKMNPFLFIPLFGLCYLIGIGLMMIGEKKEIKIEKSRFSWCQLGFFPTFYTETTKMQLDLQKMIFEKLSDKSNKDDYLKMRERYIIFKQACGNCALSFIFSIIIFALKIAILRADFIPTLIMIIIMFLSLFPLTNGFDTHHTRKKIWEDLILNNQNENSKRIFHFKVKRRKIWGKENATRKF